MNGSDEPAAQGYGADVAHPTAHPDLYRGVPPEQLARFVEFRRTHPLRQVEIGGRRWSYIISGRGTDTVLVLPGALGAAESAWNSIGRLESNRRVVCPSYPPVPTMAELADGLAALLGYLQCGVVAVFGASYGGLVAQVLVRRHAAVVRDLVLSHTAFPDERRGIKIARAMSWLRWLPMSMLRSMLLRKLTALIPASRPEAALQHAYMREVLTHGMTRHDLITSYLRVADFDRRFQFTPADLAGWPGRILLLMADDDPGTPAPVRDRMQVLYPGARVRIFSGTGHATALLDPDGYYSEIERFLADR